MERKSDAPCELCHGEFYSGVIAALAVVEQFGADTLYDNIIGTVDATKLLAVARANGDMEWSGLKRYARRQKAMPTTPTPDRDGLAKRCEQAARHMATMQMEAA